MGNLTGPGVTLRIVRVGVVRDPTNRQRSVRSPYFRRPRRDVTLIACRVRLGKWSCSDAQNIITSY